MALLKCPECGNMTSEHASFCPKCGCTIAYILSYYEQKKPKPKTGGAPTLEEVMGPAHRQFLSRVKAHLDALSIPYYYDERKNFGGFRPEKNAPLKAYLGTRVDGNIYIYLYSPKTQKNESALFDESKIDDYIAYIFRRLFVVEKHAESQNIQQNADKTTDENRHEMSQQELLSHLKSTYHYMIKDNEVLKVNVTEIVDKEGTLRLYYNLETGERKFCLLDNVSERLFKNREDAEEELERRKLPEEDFPLTGGVGESPLHDEVYVLYYKDQYFAGYREERSYTFFDNWTGGPLSTNKVSPSALKPNQVPMLSPDLEKAVKLYNVDIARDYQRDLDDYLSGQNEVEVRKYYAEKARLASH